MTPPENTNAGSFSFHLCVPPSVRFVRPFVDWVSNLCARRFSPRLDPSLFPHSIVSFFPRALLPLDMSRVLHVVVVVTSERVGRPSRARAASGMKKDFLFHRQRGQGHDENEFRPDKPSCLVDSLTRFVCETSTFLRRELLLLIK